MPVTSHTYYLRCAYVAKRIALGVCVCVCVDLLTLQSSSQLFFSSAPPRSPQPLIECYNKLKEHGGAVSLRLTDTWLRHYQVRFKGLI